MCLVGVDQLSRRQWRGECIVHDLNHLLWEILRYECCQRYCPRRRRSGLGTHRWSQTQGFPEIHNNKATGVLIVILQHWKIHRNKYLLINLIRYYQRSKKWMQIQSPWIISFWNKLMCKSWSTKIHFFILHTNEGLKAQALSFSLEYHAMFLCDIFQLLWETHSYPYYHTI